MTTTVMLTVPAHDQHCVAAAQAMADKLSGISDASFVITPHRPPVDARAVYDAEDTGRLDDRVRPDLVIPFGHNPVHSGLWSTFKSFYSDPIAWVALLITSVLLCYGGGAAMFYVHSIHFREGGPAVSPYVHWALDSTFGWFGLTPVIAVLLPLAVRLCRGLPGWAFVLTVGFLFAIITTPGPLAHDLIVARGTPVANVVTQLLGDPSVVLQPPVHYPPLTKMAHQLVAGLPVYVLLSAISYAFVRLGLKVGASTR
ncbi:hypothetical protein FKR81_31150 [Lentzea tibetensis]|uniref:Uncharacterized protein n=1 Tax=Lentzea tibetensis TaxID=2591470 RepID=A0A563EMH9_9PSEU|nr:hypothetical protein [Lentzea tibetensis]TWP47799.1 hypothetical protein FKR81_31150 [Lentzea tibetensis]